MSDSALSVRYRKFRYQAQSDIDDHGYRTKCPPMKDTHGIQQWQKTQTAVEIRFVCLRMYLPTRGYGTPVTVHTPYINAFVIQNKLVLAVIATEYTECWPCTLFDIFLNKYFPAG
jgi:hypothetical protein